MSNSQNKLSRFWQEFKRRKIIHVITLYASAAFMLIEPRNKLTEPLNLTHNMVTLSIEMLDNHQ